MDWKAVKSLQTTGSELAGRKAEEALAEHWPKVQELVREKVGPAALAAAKDDEQLTSLLKVVYDALPFPLRPLVKQDVFLRYCLKSRDKLLSAEA